MAWNDWGSAYGHARSRVALMRDCLRRAACWAKAYAAEDAWPFFDITEYVDAGVRVEPGVAAELDDYLWNNIGRPTIERTCRGAVRWPALKATTSVKLPDLPAPTSRCCSCTSVADFTVEEFIDLNGAMVRLGTLEDHLAEEPVVALDPSTLDALDARVSWWYDGPHAAEPLITRHERR